MDEFARFSPDWWIQRTFFILVGIEIVALGVLALLMAYGSMDKLARFSLEWCIQRTFFALIGLGIASLGVLACLMLYACAVNGVCN